MNITDPIADMLTRIRNANTAKKSSVDVPASNMKKAIAQILFEQGYKRFQRLKRLMFFFITFMYLFILLIFVLTLPQFKLCAFYPIRRIHLSRLRLLCTSARLQSKLNRQLPK